MDINYHSKDIFFKTITEYENETLEVLGVNLPRVARALPTEFPELKIQSKRADGLFELQDGSLLLQEFESNINILENFIGKYAQYLNYIIGKYCVSEGVYRKVHLLVVYTSEITFAENEFDFGGLKITATNVFLNNFDGDSIYGEIKAKIENGDILTIQEQLKFSLLPLMASSKEKSKVIEDSCMIIKKIQDNEIQKTVLGGIISTGRTYILKNQGLLKLLKGLFSMTALREVVRAVYKDEIKEEVEERVNEVIEGRVNEVIEERIKEVAKNLSQFLKIEEVAKNMNLSVEEVERLIYG